MIPCALLAALALAGCRTPAEHRERADQAAMGIIEEHQAKALGRTEPFSIERPQDTFRERLLLDQHLPRYSPASLGSDALEEPEHWPETGEALEAPAPFIPGDPDEAMPIDLLEALQLAAGNSREYQNQKESVFLTALNLDLERYAFDTTFTGFLEGLLRHDDGANETGVQGSGEFGFDKTFETGVGLSGRLIVDLVRLLSGSRDSSLGLFGDASITVPLLRGSGRHIVTEARTQAERDVVYALLAFEEFKRDYAVQVANGFFSVLQTRDQIVNAEANYNRLVLLVNRTQALYERGRVTGIEVDQARQDLLRAREQWIAAQQRYQTQLDNFKLTLGLPTDARIELDEGELDRLLLAADTILGDAGDTDAAATDELKLRGDGVGGRYEIAEARAIELAWENRLDLRIAEGEVEDAQRRVVVAADALRPGLNLIGSASVGERRGIGSAGLANARLDPSSTGIYSIGLEADLPWSRRAEGLAFRRSLLEVEQSVRNLQALEDQVKLDVRNGLRNLLQQRENYQIRMRALDIAERRVRQAQAFQEAGRAETRDVLEANEDLLNAQNSRVDALVSYRIAELAFQRDLGVLGINERGLWEEFDPAAAGEPELGGGEG